MAPWGGREAFFGTDPLAAAAPAGARPAIVLDMATSVTARGKIRLAAQRGDPIPEGWALDAEGLGIPFPAVSAEPLGGGPA